MVMGMNISCKLFVAIVTPVMSHALEYSYISYLINYLHLVRQTGYSGRKKSIVW